MSAAHGIRATVCLTLMVALAGVAATYNHLRQPARTEPVRRLHGRVAGRGTLDVGVRAGRAVWLAARRVPLTCSGGTTLPASFGPRETSALRTAATSARSTVEAAVAVRYPDGAIAWSGHAALALTAESARHVSGGLALSARLYQHGAGVASCRSAPLPFTAAVAR